MEQGSDTGDGSTDDTTNDMNTSSEDSFQSQPESPVLPRAEESDTPRSHTKHVGNKKVN